MAIIITSLLPLWCVFCEMCSLELEPIWLTKTLEAGVRNGLSYMCIHQYAHNLTSSISLLQHQHNVFLYTIMQHSPGTEFFLERSEDDNHDGVEVNWYVCWSGKEPQFTYDMHVCGSEACFFHLCLIHELYVLDRSVTSVIYYES